MNEKKNQDPDVPKLPKLPKTWEELDVTGIPRQFTRISAASPFLR